MLLHCLEIYYLKQVLMWIGFTVVCLAFVKSIFVFSNWTSRKRFHWVKGDSWWVVVTGATDGIGYEFACQLAAKGYHLLLLSRTESKLIATIDRIRSTLPEDRRNSIQIKILAVDFTSTDIYPRISQFLQPYQSHIFALVNNVGFAPSLPRFFYEEKPEFHDELINVNLLSMLRMTEIVLPWMIEKKRGLVINVSSASANFPLPMLAAYGAAKAYVTQLSRVLSEECRRHNILVHCVSPNFVSTKLTYHARENLLIPSAHRYVSGFLSSLRHFDNIESDGYILHSVLHRMVLALSGLSTSKHLSRGLYHFAEMANRRHLHNLAENQPLNLPVSVFGKAMLKAIFTQD